MERSRSASLSAPVVAVAWRRHTAKRFLDRLTLAHIGAILAAAVIVYAPSFSNPLRLWDHHVILLLAKAPQFSEGLFWRLVHYRIGFEESAGSAYVRVLSMPVTWALAWLFGDQYTLYYATHVLIHAAVAVVLYWLAVDCSGDRTLSVLIALLFTVYGGHGDTVNLPVYSFLLLALLLVAIGLRRCLSHVRTGAPGDFVVGVGLVTLAALLYDAFVPLALALPSVALVAAIRSRRAVWPSVRAAGTVLLGVFLVFGGVVGSLGLAPAPEGLGDQSVTRPLSGTASVLLRGGRVAQAVARGVEALAADAQVFLPGHTPGVWHRGNLPYWDLAGLRQLQWPLGFALVLMLGALGLLRHVRSGWRLLGAAMLAGGAVLDPRMLLLAVPLAVASSVGWPSALDHRVLLMVAAGLLVSLTIALGRPGGYNVVAFRHHYVTGFFVIAALAAWLGVGWARQPEWRRWAVWLALGVAVVMNGRVATGILTDVKTDNAGVFAFDGLLGSIAERHGRGSLFVTFSPSLVRGLDWNGFPAQDVAFDILHYGGNPLTRYPHRAPLLVGQDGVVRSNPVFGRPATGAFLFRFQLTRLPPAPSELFGSSPLEPRIVLTADGLVVRVHRRADGKPATWAFPLPVPVPVQLPQLLTVALADGVLRVTLGGGAVGQAVMPPPSLYHSWESDNAALLGRGFERLVAGGLVYDTYMRIGPAPSDGA